MWEAPNSGFFGSQAAQRILIVYRWNAFIAWFKVIPLSSCSLTSNFLLKDVISNDAFNAAFAVSLTKTEILTAQVRLNCYPGAITHHSGKVTKIIRLMFLLSVFMYILQFWHCYSSGHLPSSALFVREVQLALWALNIDPQCTIDCISGGL